MSALVKQLRLLQAWYLPAGPEPEEAMPSKYRAFKEAADRIVELERDLAAAKENLQSADEDRLRMRAQTARLDAALIEKDISIAAREAELAAMKQGKALADGMANMIRGFILKTVERETLDESAAKYRKWEEDYCHSDFTKLNRDEWKRKAEEAARDSARYRWLADTVLSCDYGDNNYPGKAIGWRVMPFFAPVAYGETIDAAIDAAIAAKGGGNG